MSLLSERSFGTRSRKTIWWHGPPEVAASSFSVDDAIVTPLLAASPTNDLYVPEGHFWGSFPGTNKVMPLARANVVSVAGNVVTVYPDQAAAFFVGYALFAAVPASDGDLFNQYGVYNHSSAFFGAAQGTVTAVNYVTGAVTLSAAPTVAAGAVITSKQYVRGIAERDFYLGKNRGVIENCLVALYDKGWLNRNYIPFWDRQLQKQFNDIGIHQQFANQPPLV